MNDNQLSIIPLGGVGDVTRNMYVYEYNNEILIVDCGLGFADETMLGVDLLLPDITYLLQTKKKIVGFLLTHGHEDHIGGLPFILPQLLSADRQQASFPVFASPLTAALANQKLKEFNIKTQVQTVQFDDSVRKLGSFTANFIRVTHSVPDTAHIFIKTPAGNIYHGSDYKFDLTPYDNKRPEFDKIAGAAEDGIMCLLSDCLGADREGHTPSEITITENFEHVIRETKGKVLLTTYSSNISRLNQAIEVGRMFNRKVAFIGRSLVNATDVAQRMGYMPSLKGLVVELDQVRNMPDRELLLLVAGSQGQENSAMTRIANDEHRNISLTPKDCVIFSSDAIPGNEVAVNHLVDTIAKKGARVVASNFTDEYHVSGHGHSFDLEMLMALAKPKYLLPIGGAYRQMVAYRDLAYKLGYNERSLFLLEDGQEVQFQNGTARLGKKLEIRNVFMDEVSGEELENFILRDRQKISKEGIAVVIAEIDSSTGDLISDPDIIVKAFMHEGGQLKELARRIAEDFKAASGRKKGRVTDWLYYRKILSDVAQRRIYKEIKRQPLVLPIIIEV